MKRILCFLMVLVALVSSAQIDIENSKVDITAYWSKGDKYKYEKELFDYTIQGTDTTYNGGVLDVFTLEVVDSMPDGYIVEYRSLSQEIYMSDPTMKNLLELAYSAIREFPIRYKTDIHGSLLDVVNFEEYSNAVAGGIDIIFSELNSRLKEEKIDKASCDSLNIVITTALERVKKDRLSKHNLLSDNPFSLPFGFHGKSWKLNHGDISNIKASSPWNTNEMVDVECDIYIPELNPETSWVNVVMNQSYNRDQLKSSYAEALKNLFSSLGRQLDLNTVSLDVDVANHLSLYVHTNTGWVDNVYYQSRIEASGQVKIKGWTMNLILDE